ncbi:MAG: UDP-N-acetylglucosamine 2-epimerase (non-hydrolyzing) [Bacteroidota bacterium]
MKKNILIVVGTRPNFIKVTQFKKNAANYKHLDLKIVHTGQHYDGKMADVFFEQFKLTPDYFLNIAQGTPNSQIAEIMTKLEELMINKFTPDLLIVVGDVNSTLAAAITANKMGIKLAHLESGLRSYDEEMPEEHNRIVTDKLTNLFFVTEQSGLENLTKDGVTEDRILFSGNTMIDTLVAFSKEVDASDILVSLNLNPQKYVLITMHRPATVDDKEGLTKLARLLEFITHTYKVVFPIHPRTLKKLDEHGLKKAFLDNPNLILTEPLDYFAFQKLIKHSKFILTDSGGIQEESTFVGIPCLTLRPNTERPVTVTEGTNTLVPFDLEIIKNYVGQIENGTYKKGNLPKFWDGKSTERIMEFLAK